MSLKSLIFLFSISFQSFAQNVCVGTCIIKYKRHRFESTYSFPMIVKASSLEHAREELVTKCEKKKFDHPSWLDRQVLGNVVFKSEGSRYNFFRIDRDKFGESIDCIEL